MSIEAIQYRQAAFSEAAALALTMERANAPRAGEPVPEVASGQALEDVDTRMKRIAARTYAAAYGERIIGFALSHPLIETGDPHAYTDTQHLSFLMVDPDYWGRGIASNLIDLTADHARATRRGLLTLWTDEIDNDRARALYGRKGFILSGVRRTIEQRSQLQYVLNL